MESLLTGEIRDKTKQAAKSHKASWIELGRYLYSIHKDKMFKEWGYLSFQTYCKKELGVKETTASKLLKSYLFLEKEEPQLTKKEYFEEETEKPVPDYESVNLLRLAQNNDNIPSRDLGEIRESVIDQGKDPKEVKSQVKRIIEEANPVDEMTLRDQKRKTSIRRLVTMMSGFKKEFSSEKTLPNYLFTQMNDLIEKLEDQLEE